MSGKAEVIGRDGKPVRVITFAGGGFSTALHLGVTHALLVSNSRRPDMVVGTAAGAVAAVTLAEVFQAGDLGPLATGDPQTDAQTSIERQVARFREVLEDYHTAPERLVAELLPDSLQIDTQRPLAPLDLPIHAKSERDARQAALHARSGLVNVYNQLLQLRVSVGKLTRAIRRILGGRAAREIPNVVPRIFTTVSEGLRLVALAGSSLAQLAPLVPVAFLASVQKGAPPRGSDAGDLISRSPMARAVVEAASCVLSMFALAIAWWPVAVFTAIVGLLSAMARVVLFAFQALGRWWRDESPDDWAPSGAPHRTPRQVLSAGLRLAFSLTGWITFWSAVLLSVGSGLDALLTGSWIGMGRTAVWTVYAALALLAWGLVGWIALRRKDLAMAYLRRNGLASGLLNPNPLRALFVRRFDTDFYGEIEMRAVIEAALGDKHAKPRGDSAKPKTIASYGRAANGVRVGIIAANVGDGKMEILKDHHSVVDGLMAALATPPFFPPKKLGDTLYVAGSHVGRETMSTIASHLRRCAPAAGNEAKAGQLNRNATELHVYSVSPLPLNKRRLPLEDSVLHRHLRKPGAHWRMVDVATRAIQLRSYRDAAIERRLTELYTRAMPKEGGILFDAGPAHERDSAKTYLRTWVYPIEPQSSMIFNVRLALAKSDGQRRKTISRAVADGCRATLETLIQNSFPRDERATLPCHEVVKRHRENAGNGARLPGSSDDPVRHGPGLREVCKHCALNRDDKKAIEKRHLMRTPADKSPPPWPQRDAPEEPPRGHRLTPEVDPTKAYAVKEMKRIPAQERTWPWDPPDSGRNPKERPTVSLLFSGGVFRGVFQVGVVNALQQVGLRPDIVAGASIGSITAAMVAQLFTRDVREPADKTVETERRFRRADEIQQIAGTYMAVDRLVQTDRFADFVRTLTVRSASTKFSLRNLDRVLRQYDRAWPGQFSQEARSVLAGVERLFYVSPFEFERLIKTLRLRRWGRVLEQLMELSQDLLNRGDVGDEILGSEPLELLIAEHVLPAKTPFDRRNRHAVGFDHFLPHVILLATATNLTKGRLEILGDKSLARKERTRLIQGLLASSAFPAVFRPRHRWEVEPGSSEMDLLTDGGVMDNLPLTAVAGFLDATADAELITARPRVSGEPVPHLLLSASLKRDPQRLHGAAVDELQDDCIKLTKRAGELGYNRKIQLFENAQRALRRIHVTAGDKDRNDANLKLLDLETVTVRPRWLCGTFAFHPMLGFRRIQQARSIAHGCASTLIELGRRKLNPVHANWLVAWGVDVDRLPDQSGEPCSDPFEATLQRTSQTRGGMCWFQPDYRCPFSAGALTLNHEARKEVSRIHRECGRISTHRSGT